jgi:MurNAc alpha-1-phosphate uridylyltransferase
MIFAAGRGTRMGVLTADRPKPLIPVAGRALIDHAIDLTAALPGAVPLVNLHYKGWMIRDHLAGRNLSFSEEDILLETGGGLRAALPLLPPGPVLTLNADAVWSGPNPLTRLTAAWDGLRMDALLMLVPLARATGHQGRGDFAIDPDGRLSRRGPWVYTGAQMVNPNGLNSFTEAVFSMNRLWDQAAAAGRLFGVVHDGGWCDVGQPSSIPLAEQLLAGRT